MIDRATTPIQTANTLREFRLQSYTRVAVTAACRQRWNLDLQQNQLGCLSKGLPATTDIHEYLGLAIDFVQGAQLGIEPPKILPI